MKISANFTGALDRDSDDRFVKEGDYRILENGIIDRDEDGGRYILKNLRSTSLVSGITEFGKFVGGKERRGFYYAFFYEEAVRTLTLYRVELSSGEYVVVFQRVLEDTYLIDDMKSFEYTPPSYEGLALFDFFQRYTYGTPYMYMATSLVSNQEFSVVTGETAGAAFVDLTDINEYFRVVGAGGPGAYVLCKVPIRVNGTALFDQSFANGILNPFASVADFSSVFTVKNKGLANEYVLCNAPLHTYGDFGSQSPAVFASSTSFVSLVYKEEEVIDENAIYKSVTYNHVNKILSIDFVENQSNGDLLCYWTDGVNPPFAININFLLNGSQYPHVRDMFNIKPSPAEPRVQFYRDYSSSDVNTRVLNFQFAQRHLYKDGDYTPLSTFSQSAFIPNKIIGASSSDSANIGYYLEAGILYRFTGFNKTNAILVYDTGNVGYNKLLCSSDGNFIFIHTSGGTALPVLHSTNYGSSFDSGPSHSWTRNGCMSIDGRYIYMGSTSLWFSDNYGGSFRVIRSNTIPIGDLKCSNDGRYLVGVRAATKISENLLYAQPFFMTNFGETFQDVDLSLSSEETEIDTASRGVAISESGANIVFNVLNRLIISRNFGQSFDISTSPFGAEINDMVIYDNGRGFASGFISNNFFATSTGSFFNFTASIRLNYASVLKVGAEWIKVGLDGTEIGRIALDSKPTFTDGSDLRTSLKSVENFVNTVDIQIQKPSPIVEKVEVFAIDTDSGLAYIIDTINNNAEELPVGGTVVKFKNSLVYRVLSDTEKNVLFSNVPKVAKLQSIVGNRLFYFDYTEGYDGFNPNFSAAMVNRIFRSLTLSTSQPAPGQILMVSGMEGSYVVEIGDVITFAFTYTDTEGLLSIFRFQYRFNSGYNSVIDASEEIQASWHNKFPTGSVLPSGSGLNFNMGSGFTYIDVQIASINEVPLTYKRGQSMSVGIVYYDEYNRGSFPVFDDSDVFVPADLSKPKNELRVEIKHVAPEWAVGYKFVRTDRNLHYQIIPGFQFAKVERGSVYLMKYDSDLYLPEPGMYLDAITGDGDIISFAVTGKVMRDVDFVDGSPAGEWIVIQAPDTPGYMTQDVSNGTHRFFDTIFYSRQNIEAADDVLFYEIPGVHRIRNGYHVGNFRAQTGTGEDESAIHIIKHDGNCFNITSANVELVSIGNNMTFVNGGRALVAIENPRQIHRYSSLTWSEVFSQTSGINGLSMFNALLGNSKHLEPSNGDINAILPIETNITLWQEDQVGQILVNKNALVTATGDQVVGRSSDVVGDFIPYAGEYGTTHPESIVSFGGVRFFVDVKRNAVCRIGQEGIYEIQIQGMAAVFNKVLDKDDLYISSINPDHKEFWLYSDAQREIFVYNYAQNAWVRTIKPIRMTDMFSSGKLVYSLDSAQEVRLHSHMSAVGYGQIYGEPAPLKFEYVANVEPGIVKVYEALELEANRPIPITVSVAGSYNSGEEFNSSEITEEMFEFREGEYFSYISGAKNSKIGNEEGVIIPVGTIKSVVGNVVTFLSNISAPIGLVNHSVFVHDGSESGTLKALLDSDSQVGENFINTPGFTQSDVGKFVFLIEKSYLNGHKLRAPFVRVTMRNEDYDKLGVFACRLRVNKSHNE